VIEMNVVRCVASVALAALALVLAAGPGRATDPPTLGERAAIIERVSTEPDGNPRRARTYLANAAHPDRRSAGGARADRARMGRALRRPPRGDEGGLTLGQVVAGFRSGTSWEAIARDHRLDLDKLTADVSRSQDIVERRAEDRAPAVTSAGGAGRRGSTAHQSGGEAGGWTGRTRR
jgi:hypothetical protein